MMQMMFAINKNDFGGSRDVTCYSCHRGAPKPAAIPSVENGLPRQTAADPEHEKPRSDLPTADQLIDNFVRALGGASAIEKITTRVEGGSAQVDGKSIRIELLTKGPDEQVLRQHTPAGDSITAVRGNAGWVSIPGHPTREIGGSDLEAARLDADLQFALHIKRNFPELRVEHPERINGREAYVLMGIQEGRPPWRFFFDTQSGLLVRLVRYTDSPLGLDPTRIDYSDYRAVDGVQTPLAWTIARPLSELTIQIEEIRQNVPIDDAEFGLLDSGVPAPH